MIRIECDGGDPSSVVLSFYLGMLGTRVFRHRTFSGRPLFSYAHDGAGTADAIDKIIKQRVATRHSRRTRAAAVAASRTEQKRADIAYTRSEPGTCVRACVARVKRTAANPCMRARVL
uniref:Uncharacterized protein n=1 Tax=Sipha flava TaxID=143950 RepID=A0A2S2Q953_9HEMI